MMRKLVVFLILLSTVFASCEGYVYSAVHDFGSACVYPECFGAAGRYKEAAVCYANKSNPDFNMDQARVYFQKAANYYIQNIVNLPIGGDYPLRAPSYEYAGDMTVQMGNYAQAKKYYDAAIAEYMLVDNFVKVSEVRLKDATMGQTPVVPVTAEATSSQNLYLGALFFIIAVIALAMFFFRKRTPPKEEFQPIRSEPSFKAEPRESKEPAKDSAKEKMRDKIRKKYGLE
jgi:tetratricopeptide (TPR) repeat protein